MKSALNLVNKLNGQQVAAIIVVSFITFLAVRVVIEAATNGTPL